jgi:tetratricopeptide (TPR) repeat protein
MAKRFKSGKQEGQSISELARLVPRDWIAGLILVLAVILVYLPVGRAGFLWDDRLYITGSSYMGGLAGLKEIWTSSVADISPMTFTTFWLEHALWGFNPLPYHMVNVVMHGACAVLLWQILRNLAVPGAWLGAALWALHPVEVESVAWVTEMKNTESGLFYLLSVLCYLQAPRAESSETGSSANGSYGLSLFWAAMAMASKSSTVVLPVVLCLCVWWRDGCWDWRNVTRVLPFVLLALAASALSIWTQKLQLAQLTDPQWARSWPERVVTAGVAIWFYLGKLIWPQELMSMYPRWRIDAGQWESYLPVLAVIITLLVLWLKRKTWLRPVFFVFAYFIVALLPVLGLVDNYIFHYSLVFDHLQYLASMGPLALAGAAIARLASWFRPEKNWLQPALATALLVILGCLSWQRARAFESEESLWTDTLTKNPTSWTARYNLGVVFLGRGELDRAQVEFEKTLELFPNFDEGHLNLGLTFLRKGETDPAIAQFRTALAIDPAYAEAHNDLGTALEKKGQKDAAETEFQKAAELNPGLATASYNLGLLLLQKGKTDEAMEQFERAVEADSNLAEAHAELGKLLAQKGQVDDAIGEYEKAVEINPNSESTQSNLGVALYQTGQKEEGTIHLQKAVEINPASAQAHNNLGNAFLENGQLDYAMAEYLKALAINPNLADAHRNLGLVFLHEGRAGEAVLQFQDVLRVNPSDGYAQKALLQAQAMARQKPTSP